MLVSNGDIPTSRITLPIAPVHWSGALKNSQEIQENLQKMGTKNY
jgi:hypothetical protein